jgi:putative ABC transport system ATP-binding protein
MSTPHAISNTNVSLQALSVSKSFVSGRVHSTVLQNLTLDVCASELALISGPSGCGMQPADGGRVRALGQELSGLSINDLERFRLQHTGFVFQGFNLFPALTALEQVELPLSYMGLPKGMARKRAVESLEEVGLGPRMRLRPAELSGGEKQRVAIARALAKQPELLFADEPTSALDSDNGQIIIDILHRIARNHGTTVLCVSHDPRLVGHADRVLAMEDGRILSDHVPPASASKASEAKEPSA